MIRPIILAVMLIFSAFFSSFAEETRSYTTCLEKNKFYYL